MALLTKRGGAQAPLIAFDPLRLDWNDLRLRLIEERSRGRPWPQTAGGRRKSTASLRRGVGGTSPSAVLRRKPASKNLCALDEASWRRDSCARRHHRRGLRGDSQRRSARSLRSSRGEASPRRVCRPSGSALVVFRRSGGTSQRRRLRGPPQPVAIPPSRSPSSSSASAPSLFHRSAAVIC